MKNLFATLFMISVLALSVNAQIRTPAASPFCKMTQTVGLTDITVEYSRPSMKDRTIFASNGLVPYGKVWRTGANSVTKITFSDDVKVGGKELEKGSYALLTVPGSSQWTIQLYKHESTNWGSYVEKDPDAKVTVEALNMGDIKVETFMIDINNIRNNSASLNFIWESTFVAVPVEVEVDSKVTADIKRVMAGPSGNDYFAAATYYHEAGKDLKQALAWIQKATSVENPRFWQVRREALILADLGKHKEAIAVAKKSMVLAKEAGNDDYVKMNEKSIAEWMNK